MNALLTSQPTFVALPTFRVLKQGQPKSAVLDRFQQRLRDGGYAQTNVATYMTKAHWLMSLLPDPGMLSASPRRRHPRTQMRDGAVLGTLAFREANCRPRTQKTQGIPVF